MSIALLVTFEPDALPPGRRGDLYLPIASQQTFVEHWTSLATTLELEFVPLFEVGIPVGVEDLPAVVEELELLAAHASAALPSWVTERVHLLLEQLRALDPATVRHIFIG